MKLIQYHFVFSAGREVQGDSVKSVPPLFPSLFPWSHRELQQQVEKVEPLSTPKVASMNCVRSQILATASANVFTFKTSGKHLSKHLYLPFLYLCSAANSTNEDNDTLLGSQGREESETHRSRVSNEKRELEMFQTSLLSIICTHPAAALSGNYCVVVCCRQ